MAPVIPMFSLYSLRGGNQGFTYATAVCFLIAAIAAECFSSARIVRLRGGLRPAVAICVVGILLSATLMVSSGGLASFNLNLFDVYQFRSLVNEELYVGFAGYLHNWAFRVLTIVLLAYALYKKQWGWFLVLVAVQVFFFGMSSQKKVLLMPLLVLGLFMVRKSSRLPEIMAFAVAALTVLLGAIAMLFDQLFPFSLLIRRALFVPANLNFAYFDYFREHGNVYLSNGILSGVISYPFEEVPPRLVSVALQGDAGTWMNTGFLGTSYMHFGYAGMILFSGYVGLLIGMVEAATAGRLPAWLGLSVVVIPFLNLFTEADLTTALGTHGLALGIVLLHLMASGQADRGIAKASLLGTSAGYPGRATHE
jgi:hypothetical protein